MRRCLTLGVGLLLPTAVSAGPAWAHGGGGGAPEGYVFVQQALGHLAHDTGPTGITDAEASVGQALSATDQEGVDVAWGAGYVYPQGLWGMYTGSASATPPTP